MERYQRESEKVLRKCAMIKAIAAAGSMFLILIVSTAGQGGDDPKDPKNWTPIKIQGRQKAPEFEDIAEWLNSPALTMKELKGKVVVVHFMAFG
jgi:hypothetical protein